MKVEIDFDFELNPDNRITELVIKTSSMKVHSYEAHIIQIIVEYFSVKVIYSSLFSLERLREEKTLEFFGTEQSVKMAEYVYLFLQRTVLQLWHEHKKLCSQKGLKNKNQFLCGVLMGLEKHLKDSQQKKPKIPYKKGSSLPAVLDEKLQIYISRKHPKIRVTTSRQSVQLTDAYRNGFIEGNKIRIRKPLGKKQIKFLL